MPSFDIVNSVALVTGTNKENGIGQAIVRALLENGAAKVYATARDKSQLNDLVHHHDGKVVAVSLDVTDYGAIEALPKLCPDVTIVVNNAGYAVPQDSLQSISAAEVEMKVNYLAPMAIVKSFAPIFEKVKDQSNGNSNAPTALVNINSIASMVNFPGVGTYSASKAAAHSLTQAQRRDLAPFNTLVIGVYPGPIDTAMAEKVLWEKTSPSTVADRIVEALTSGQEDLFPDPTSLQLFDAWKADAKALEKQTAGQKFS